MVNLNRLHCFFVCAQTRQVTKAANILGVTQPSLSQQLKSFEEELGFDLFVRAARTFELTPKGRLLYEKSIELFNNVETITDFIKNKQTIEHPKFTIGVSDEIERPFIAEVVGKLLKMRRSVLNQFHIVSKTHESIAASFNAGKIDLLVTCKSIPNFVPIAVFNFPVHLVTSKRQNETFHFKDHNIKRALAHLQEKLVLPSAELPFRGEVDRFLIENSIQVASIFESNILACTVRAIREGVGCGFLPLPYILSDSKRNLLSVIGPSQGYWQQQVFLYKAADSNDLVGQHFSQIITTYL